MELGALKMREQRDLKMQDMKLTDVFRRGMTDLCSAPDTIRTVSIYRSSTSSIKLV